MGLTQGWGKGVYYTQDLRKRKIILYFLDNLGYNDYKLRETLMS
jgi:hypothetical protein